MTVQEAMKLSDEELMAQGKESLKRWHQAYQHFNSTKEFADRCASLLERTQHEHNNRTGAAYESGGN
ncbi:hypothetical protein EHC20_17815 [Escherichia coli]|nr:hypothetical protein [Escherichia coli]